MLFALLAVLQQPVSPPPSSSKPAADTSQGRPCEVAIDTLPRVRQVTAGTATNYFGGGGVVAHCKGTGTRLKSDSVAYFSGAGEGRFDMIGNVHIRDTSLALDAAFASYFLDNERLEAHNRVVAVNHDNHSVLRGPNLTYYRAVKGVRDTLELFASSRPTIEYRGAADSSEPYIIVGDRVRFKGNDRMWGGGKVTIDRSDLASRSDSLALDETLGLGVLVGHPSIAGKDSSGTRSYTLVGTRIELGLTNREIRRVKALGAGQASGADWTLTADTIHLALERRKLQRALAWGRSSRPHAVSSLQTFDADSLALDAPDQVLTELRGFGKAFSTSQRDTTARRRPPPVARTSTPSPSPRPGAPTAPRDTVLARWVEGPDFIAGDSLTAHWMQEPDSAGKPRPQLRTILARGAARALTHLTDDKDSTAGPSLNYSRGASIAIALSHGKMDRVVAGGRADGVHLEPRPPLPDTTKRVPSDTVKRRPAAPKAPPPAPPARPPS